MSFLEVYAFFLSPILLVVFAGFAAWLHIWNSKRHDRQHPAE